MAGIPTEIPEGGIPLTRDGEPERKPTRLEVCAEAQAYLSDPEVWANYEDRFLAEAESILRSWMEEMCKVPKWRATSAKCRRYTFSMLFEILTGEPYDQKRHASQISTWTTLFRYYSSRVQKAGSINGKMYTKTIYVISPKRLKRPPYSIRLRIPWLVENGYAIDRRTMIGPNSDLVEPGHARNPRTEENMRLRRKKGRERYAKRAGEDAQGV